MGRELCEEVPGVGELCGGAWCGWMWGGAM